MKIFKTGMRIKHEAIAELDLLIRRLKRDGFSIVRCYLIPENEPCGYFVEHYQYAVVVC